MPISAQKQIRTQQLYAPFGCKSVTDTRCHIRQLKHKNAMAALRRNLDTRGHVTFAALLMQSINATRREALTAYYAYT